jgi:tetratricopeptide (TPR) repeat protein
MCAFRLGNYREAAGAFRVSIALSPEAPECHYNRGLAYQSLDRLDEALADYNRALRLNEHFTDASINRGMIYYRLGRHREARDDLERALATATSTKLRGIIHYDLALVDRAAGDRESCAANVRAALEFGNTDARALNPQVAH